MLLDRSRARLTSLIINFPDEHVIELIGALQDWYKDLKEWEADDTWAAALTDSRITARQVIIPDRGASFAVRNKADGNVERTFNLNKGGGVITEHGNPKNFLPHPVSGRSLKYDKGLHDLSATLIAPGREIYGQLKPYETAEIIFMAVPLPEDLEIIFALKDMVTKEMAEEPDFISMVRLIKANVTRIKYAQADDMHTTYVDVSDPGAERGKFKYGIGGTLLDSTRQLGFRKVKDEDVTARKTNAYGYRRILNSPKKNGGFHVNEIVMAYRAHESEIFPIFATWDSGKKIFQMTEKSGARRVADAMGKLR